MIITVVCDVLGEENNGVVIAEMNLIRYLKSAGHDVRVLCPDETKEGTEGFYVVPTRSFDPFDDYVRKNGVSLAKPDDSVVMAAVEGADLMHLMLPFTLSKAALAVAKEYGIPTTAGVHLMAENFSMHLFMGGVKLAILLCGTVWHNLHEDFRLEYNPSATVLKRREKVRQKKTIVMTRKQA